MRTSECLHTVSTAYLLLQERKKQSAVAEVEGKANVWMQCDRCKYTTPYSSFMINHIHKHGEDKKLEQPEDNDTPQVL